MPSWLHVDRLSPLIRPERYLTEVVAAALDDVRPVGSLPASDPVSWSEVEAAVGRVVMNPLLAPILRTVVSMDLRVADVKSVATMEGVSPSAARRRVAAFRARRTRDRRLDGVRDQVVSDVFRHRMTARRPAA